MKYMISAILIALSFQANARVIEGPELQNYIKAANVAIGIHDIFCFLERSDRHGWWVNVTISSATSVEISDGEQPILIFSTPLDAEKMEMVQMAITTDSTFKKIIDIKGIYYILGDINDGTLLNPVMRRGYVPVRKCQAQI